MLGGIAIAAIITGVLLVLFGLIGERLWLLGRQLSRWWGEFAQGIGFVLGWALIIGGIGLYPDQTVDRSAMAKAADAAPDAPPKIAQSTRPVPSKAGETFQDCPDCPELVVLPQGKFSMGASETDPDRTVSELPAHHVNINAPLLMGRYEVTVAQWDICTREGSCRTSTPPIPGHAEHPVVNVSWQDAQDYLAFLSKKTGAEYRLPTEAEWEYAARATQTTRYPWGHDIGVNHASCDDCATSSHEKTTHPIGQFGANAFRVFDMLGNVREWVMDCWHDNYDDAPEDGSAWVNACSEGRRVTRGGAWNMPAQDLRVSARGRETWDSKASNLGFRVVRVAP